MKSLVKKVLDMNIPFPNKALGQAIPESVDEYSSKLLSSGPDEREDFRKMISELWKDKAIQVAFRRRNEFSFIDSTEYYIRNIDRIIQPEYTPDFQDIIRASTRTTGIAESEFTISPNIKIGVFDVGGARSERKKWHVILENAEYVIFCVSLYEYDMVLFEDMTENRMKDSLKLFDDLLQNKGLSTAKFILLFTKSDLFKEKIAEIDIQEAFPDYKDGLNFDAAFAPIKNQFLNLNKDPNRIITSYIVNATDPDDFEKFFASVRSLITDDHLDSPEMTKESYKKKADSRYK